MLGLPIPYLDTLLSLPLFSFLVLPSAISNFPWTSSLNLLFFWLTWATVVLSHKALNIEFYGTLVVRVVFYVVPCTLFFLLDNLAPSFAASIKTHGTRGLPRKALPKRSLRMYLGVVLLNILLAVAVQTGVAFVFTKVLRIRSAVRITMSLPMPLGLAKDLSRAYLVRGPLAYYIHASFLHAPRSPDYIKRRLSKWHAAWQHSLKTTMPFAAAYDHPVVFLVHSFLPVYLPAVMFRFHILTYFLFLILIGLEEALGWSGYAYLPSNVLLAGLARRREAHFMIGDGNYGPWGVMDWVHGTIVGDSHVIEDIGEEVDKRDVRGKARRAIDSAGDVVREQVQNRQRNGLSARESESDGNGARRALRRRK